MGPGPVSWRALANSPCGLSSSKAQKNRLFICNQGFRHELAKGFECFKYTVFQDFKTKCTQAFNEIILMQNLQPLSSMLQTALCANQTPLIFLQ